MEQPRARQRGQDAGHQTQAGRLRNTGSGWRINGAVDLEVRGVHHLGAGEAAGVQINGNVTDLCGSHSRIAQKLRPGLAGISVAIAAEAVTIDPHV